MVRQAVHPPAETRPTQAGREARLGLHQRGPGLRSYFDSSALIKAFIDELGSDDVRQALDDATAVASSLLASVECRVAFHQMLRDRRITEPQADRAQSDFAQRWSDMIVIDIDHALADRASVLGRAHPLRSSDAVHLASGLVLSRGAPGRVLFACWDRRLWDAARAEGFNMVPAELP